MVREQGVGLRNSTCVRGKASNKGEGGKERGDQEVEAWGTSRLVSLTVGTEGRVDGWPLSGTGEVQGPDR